MYLPDGSLRRKFSLPKLSDSLKAVSECRYIRKRNEDDNFDGDDVNNGEKEGKENQDADLSTNDEQDYYYYNYRRTSARRSNSKLPTTPTEKFH